MPENEPVRIINVDSDDSTDGNHEGPTGDNPIENLSHNQYGVSNTVDVTAAASAKDITTERAARDNPEGGIKVEDVYNEYYGNDIDYDAGNGM